MMSKFFIEHPVLANVLAIVLVVVGAVSLFRSEADFADALAADGVETAARLIVLNGLSAESAARRGDMAMAFDKLRSVADALNEAREIVLMARGIAA